MRLFIYLMIVTLLIIVQSTLGVLFKIGSVKPDFVLTFVMCVALIKGENLGAAYGLISGLIEDIVYGKFLGFSALVKFLTGYIVGYGTRDLFKGPIMFTIGFVFAGTLLYNLIFFMTALVLTPEYKIGFFVPVVVYSALYNAVIGPVMYSAILRLEKFLDYYFAIKY
ncbi:rod shape-determining protein MreD [Thermosediminibacter oceani]|uniref:Rod shape-determining protein MreD n=1 Tax=Thermosediminibacter oceani (strain ATCC BAA-1034 / DSM 16646 / JW/IW-1228P) TaxID=555079 RepID=D9S281_THEOJ|nr:rod shape-determining protein MreD [Thermosediminibacter oceani]ADL07508.1 rod shape-determining protein MreD [Thermosediminibacter oceani DSM 16646]